MNSFFGLGPMELVLIVFIALIVLGPQRLPGTIREVMKYWKYFRNLSGELTSQFSEEFQGLEDLNPQKILKELADELDDEVEQTKAAAGIKKPAAKKASTTKKAATPAAKTETQTKSDASAAATATAAATAAVAKSATSEAETLSEKDPAEEVQAEEEQPEEAPVAEQNVEPLEETSDSGQDTQTPQNGEMPTSVQSEESTVGAVAEQSVSELNVEVENSILPPENSSTDVADNAAQNAVSEQAVSEQAVSEQAVSEQAVSEQAEKEPTGQSEATVAEQPASADMPVAKNNESADGADVPGSDGYEETQTTKKPIGTAEPAPVSVNGQGARPEDDG